MDEPTAQRVMVFLVLMAIGAVAVGTAVFLKDWMMWATGALVIRFGMWLVED